MTTITGFFEQAQLSLAAYALGLTQGMPNADYNAALTVAGMTDTQAADFANTYTVLAQSVPTTNGFSATLFQNNQTGQKTLAIRGSDNFTDYLTDVVDVAVLGGTFGQEQYAFLNDFYQQLITQGMLSSSENFSVAGHSLGGFLAQAFSVDRPGTVTQTYTYNAPGIGGAVAEVLSWLGATNTNVAVSDMTNIQASGLSATAGLGTLLGHVQEVFTEVQSNPLNNHKLGFLTDSLAVCNLFAQLDPSLNTRPNGLTTITNILKASSNVAANSLESTITALGKLFGVTNTTFTGSEFDTNRDLLYKVLNNINAVLPSNGGSFTVLDLSALNATQLASSAKDNLAYRYALKELNPFAVLDADYSVSNSNSMLDIYNPATGVGDLTTSYLTDRASMLIALLQRNVVDNTDTTISGSDILYRDAASNTGLRFGSKLTGDDSRQHILFGDAGIDKLIGGSVADHLYGGAGDDTLTGGAGNDYLEGGAGNDTYNTNNGDGTDTLFDSDGQGRIVHNGITLSGGQSTAPNQWQDAQGNTYTLLDTAASKQDLLIDAGTEHLIVKDYSNAQLGIQLAGEVAPTPFTQSANGITVIGDRMAYQMPWSTWLWTNNPAWPYLFDANGNMVRTSVAQPYYADKIFDSAGDDNIYAGDGINVIFAYNGGNNHIQTGANDDYIVGGAGRDRIYAGGMTDTIAAGGGDDIVYGENGGDVIDGAAGNDYLSGGAGADAINGGEGNDQIYGDDSITWQHAIADSGIAVIGQGDLLAGGAGGDVVIGSANDDALLGGVGNDTLAGREGHDIIMGDAGLVFVAPPLSEFDAIIGAARWPMGPYQDFHSSFTTAPMLNIQFERIDHGIGSANRYEVKLSSLANPEAPCENWITPATTGGNDQLYGGSGNDWLFGEFGDDLLDGGTGDDVLVGGPGNDILVGGPGNDILIGGAGSDTYLINAGDGVDYIYDDISSGINSLVFGAGVDPASIKLFQGSLGLDLGNGTLVHIDGVDYNDVANTSSIQRFQFADGTVLTAQQLVARGFDLEGTDSSDLISGTNVGDRIDGGKGNDTLIGGAGADSYRFGRGDGQDTIKDFNFSGIDQLVFGAGIASSDITLSRTGNHLLIEINDPNNAAATDQITIENWNNSTDLTDQVQFADGTVWTAADLTNRSNPTSPAPTMMGTDASETFTLASDITWFDAKGGNDTIVSGASNATIYGGDGNDTITDTGGNDIIDGGAGNDTITDSGDQYTIYGGTGNDTITAIGGAGTIEGGDGNDTMTATGSDAIVTGGSGDDTITTSRGNDLLDGGTGDDTMTGGAGDDLYYVDAVGDTVAESANEGVDTVHASISYTLGVNLENLTLTGSAAINGTGNALDNILSGNSADNILDGSAGSDTLIGGLGSDTYLLGRGYGADTVQENDATGGNSDVLQFLGGIASDQIWLRKVANNLEVSVIGTTDTATLTDWYLGDQYHVEQFKTSDGKTLLDSQVQNLVSAMAGFAPPAAGQTTLTANCAAALNPVIVANWQ